MRHEEDEQSAEAPAQGAGDDGDARDDVVARTPGDDDLDLAEMTREELEGELQTARAEIERLQDQSLRRQAELVNFRRRAQKERSEMSAVAQARLLEGLVPVIDDFERAVEVESDDARTYHEGMQLILRSVHKVLEQLGVERLEPRGEPFDPRYHEAIARHQTDEVPAGRVLEVYQPGYRLDDRLIRPATVVVAHAEEPSADTDVADSREDREDVAVAEEDGGRDDG